MQKSSQINIRFDPETEEQLNQTAEALGVSKSALIRRLTEKFLQEVRKTGAVTLNPKWITDMAAADARSSWGDRKILPDEQICKVADSHQSTPLASKGPTKYPTKKESQKRKP